MHCTNILMAIAFLAPAADPQPEDTINAVKEYFSRVGAIHVVCTQRGIESGGIWSENPESAAVVYKRDGFMRTYDIWLDPPKQRVINSETKQQGGAKLTTTTQVYFDGKTYTHLNPETRSGLVMPGGALVH